MSDELTDADMDDLIAAAADQRAADDVSVLRARIAQLQQAAEAAVAFLETVEWNDVTSEHDAVNVQHQLEAALLTATGEKD